MSAIVRRDPTKAGLQLLRSRVNVAYDGFVEVAANFLAPAEGLGANSFLIDSEWPMQNLPAGVPPIQGGPFLLSRDIYKENGLTYVNAIYTSAINDSGGPRITEDRASEKLSFSAYKEKETKVTNQDGSVTTYISTDLVSFDYWSVTQTYSYALLDGASYKTRPGGRIVPGYLNYRRERTGIDKPFIRWEPVNLTTASLEKIGKVRRYRVTSKFVYQAAELDADFGPSKSLDALAALEY
jgi:hypothetical protein